MIVSEFVYQHPSLTPACIQFKLESVVRAWIPEQYLSLYIVWMHFRWRLICFYVEKDIHYHLPQRMSYHHRGYHLGDSFGMNWRLHGGRLILNITKKIKERETYKEKQKDRQKKREPSSDTARVVCTLSTFVIGNSSLFS